MAAHTEQVGDAALEHGLADLTTLDLPVELAAERMAGDDFAEAVGWQAEPSAMGTDCGKEVGGEHAAHVQQQPPVALLVSRYCPHRATAWSCSSRRRTAGCLLHGSSRGR